MSTEKPVESVKADEQKSVGATGDVAEKQVEPTKEGFETLLSEGKKALSIGNLVEAIDNLAESAAMSVKLFGEFAPDTFEPHFHYGKALLEAVSPEGDVLTLKVKYGQTDGDAADQSSKKNSQTEKKEEGEITANESKTEMETEPNGDVTADESNAEMDAEPTVEAAEIDIDQTINNEEDLDEDAQNIQSAFEALDYARLICEKNLGSTDASTWLGRQKDTLIALSKAALHDNNFETALQDLNSALKIANENFSNELREIATIKMGLAHVLRMKNDMPSAVECVEGAIKALEEFKAKIQAEPQTDEGKLLSEITEFLEDVIGEKEYLCNSEVEKKHVASKKALGEEIQKVDPSAIKRKAKKAVVEKRPAVDEGTEHESVAKKAKTDA